MAMAIKRAMATATTGAIATVIRAVGTQRRQQWRWVWGWRQGQDRSCYDWRDGADGDDGPWFVCDIFVCVERLQKIGLDLKKLIIRWSLYTAKRLAIVNLAGIISDKFWCGGYIGFCIVCYLHCTRGNDVLRYGLDTL
jgi:hypothetical protein